MGGMDHGMAGTAMPVAAGQTAEKTVTFTRAGTVPFACHLAGRDEGG
jgi:uncharacterized cupredoxin-like copper-binding protein